MFRAPGGAPKLTVVDLFSGVGSLSWGAAEAARALGFEADLVLAIDSEPAALTVYDESLRPRMTATRCLDLKASLAGVGPDALPAEQALLRDVPNDIDVLVAGPPCQGHSRLNNHSRHDDPRNDLYGTVARFAELRRPKLIIIENVDTITADARCSSETTRLRLLQSGYQADQGTVQLNRLGVPQTRKRHVLVATRSDQPSVNVDAVLKAYAVRRPEHRTVDWAITDLSNASTDEIFDSASRAGTDNTKRMAYLHAAAHRFDLPDHARPPCHRVPKVDKNGNLTQHTYRSMYGRMHPDRPAQTVTSGFGSMGQGRYVHPRVPRTITPHEAARLQFLGDFFDFSSVTSRGVLAKMIGNVAPMKLSYVFVLDHFR